MKDEAFLYLFRELSHSEIFKIDFLEFDTVNNIIGPSLLLLSRPARLHEWFSSIKFSASLPTIEFREFNKTDIEDFLKKGTKLKFLKINRGFGGEDIHVVDSVEEIKQFVDEKQRKHEIINPGDRTRRWILQDALEDVATYEGYKFHLRVLIVVVVRDKDVSVYISNYHAYEFSKELYDVKRLKERSIFNSHKHQNTKTAFFPMEHPDHWTTANTERTMNQIISLFKTIFEHQHDFLLNKYNIKNGFTLLGADVLLDSKQNPYILEINHAPVIYNVHNIFIPEYFHLAMGGAPLKLFSTLYGTPEGRTTPFIKPLETFYKTIYPSTVALNRAVEKTFLVPFDNDSYYGYLLYQNMNSKKIHRRTKRKSRLIL
jgi:hypothetical protein